MLRKLLVMTIAIVAVLLLVPTASLTAQGGPQISVQDVLGPDFVPTGPTAVSECNGGVIYDDGTPENAWGMGEAGTAWYGHRIAPGPYPYNMTQVCTWWTRTGSDSTVSYYVELYDSHNELQLLVRLRVSL